jgi:c-di-GMP-related signal transduction protein
MQKQDNATTDPLLLSRIKNVYLARQPIFDKKEKVVGYELLFRSGFDNAYDNITDGDYASSSTLMNSFVNFGLDVLTEGKPAFINFTKKLLLDETASLFPREWLTIEILETIAPDKDVVDSCRKMKKHGYVLALDDFTLSPGMKSFVDLADIIKIDFRATDTAQRRKIMTNIGKGKIKYLAEKVETHEEFSEAKENGFSLFQGYFFSKPHVVEGKAIPGYKLTYLQILKEVNDPDASFDTLEHIVKRDVSLTYNLLKFINSAAFGFKAKIQSIRQAITLLGLVEFKRWVSLLVLSRMGDDKPEELLVNSMVRAKLCEFAASKVNMRDNHDNLFLLGMLSNIDAFIDKPMKEIVENLPLSDMIKKTLCGDKTQFQDVLQMMISYEKGSWDEWTRYLEIFGLEESVFPEIYINTLDWVRKIFR